MSADCSLAVENQFGPIIDGCGSNFDFTLLFEETILYIGPLCLALILSIFPVLQLWPRRSVVRSGFLLPIKLVCKAIRQASSTNLLDNN